MGADFMVAVCRFPYTRNGKLLSESPQLASLLKKRAAELPIESLNECMAYMDCDFETTNTPEADCRDQLADYIDLVFTDSGRRDLSLIMLDGTQWLITGGMSWGDTPTEIYDAIICLDVSNVTEEPIA